MLKTKQIKIILVIVLVIGAVAGGLFFYLQQKEQQLSEAERKQQSLELTQQAEDAINNVEYEKCEKLAKQAVDLNENNIGAYLLLGRSRYPQGKLEEAKDTYLKGLEKDPQHLKMNFYLANIYRDLQEFELSKKHYKIATEIKPHDISLWHNYAVSYAFDQDDWEGAVKIYEEALKINPDDEFLQRQYESAKKNVEVAE